MTHSGTLIFMRNVPGKPDYRALVIALPCMRMDGCLEMIPRGFEWDGASSGIFRAVFPKWRHPIATCRHDYRCKNARTWQERKFADDEFKKDVGRTGWWEKHVGYLGVRAGAYLGLGWMKDRNKLKD